MTSTVNEVEACISGEIETFCQQSDVTGKGMSYQACLNAGLIFDSDKIPAQMAQRINLLTILADFEYGKGVIVPRKFSQEEGDAVLPTLFINEGRFNIPDDRLCNIEGLIYFADDALLDWLAGRICEENLLAPDNLWVFPGGGGRYMYEEFKKREITPAKYVNPSARRVLSNGRVMSVNVEDFNIPEGVSGRVVFVDDALSTGGTLEAVLAGLLDEMEVSEVTVLLEALGTPRTGDNLRDFLCRCNTSGIKVKIFSGILYGGTVQRPRLLTTGSLVDGLKNPLRLNSKGYPKELLDRVSMAIQDPSSNAELDVARSCEVALPDIVEAMVPSQYRNQVLAVLKGMSEYDPVAVRIIGDNLTRLSREGEIIGVEMLVNRILMRTLGGLDLRVGEFQGGEELNLQLLQWMLTQFDIIKTFGDEFSQRGRKSLARPNNIAFSEVPRIPWIRAKNPRRSFVKAIDRLLTE